MCDDNVLLIMLDELINLELLPEKFTNTLKGINAFKKLGINFTNYHTNRQMCSPSRTTYLTGKIDTGIIDNVEQQWQYEAKGNVYESNTLGHLIKDIRPDILTCFYGKSHLDSKLIPTIQILPKWTTNTEKSMKIYGFDKFNTFGDNLHQGHGLFSDSLTYNFNHPMDSVSYDYIENHTKQEGAIPFLKARRMDNKQFYLQVNFHNPHDIKHFWSLQNQTPLPIGDMMQYGLPYFEEQIKDWGINTYEFNKDFKDAYVKNTKLTKNWFEIFGDDTYEKYKTNKESILFYDTHKHAYCTDIDSKNTLNPFYFGATSLCKYNFTIPTQDMIREWKNYQNAYLNMISHVDDYIYGIYLYLVESKLIFNTNVIFCTDHGDSLGSYGLIEKGFPYKQTENISLIIYSPHLDIKLRGSQSNRLCSTIDMIPTILELFNIPNHNMYGQTILTKNNKCIINPIENQYTLCIINNWMTWTGIFYLMYDDLGLYKIYDNNPNDVWYKPTKPLEYAYQQVFINVKVKNQQFKYVIWYDIISYFLFDKTYHDMIIDSNIMNKIKDHLIQKYQLQHTIIDIIIKQIYQENIKFKEFIININNITQSIYKFIGTFILFRYLKHINNDSYLIRLKLPFYNMDYKEFKSYVDKKEHFYEELYIEKGKNEIYNLLDNKRNKIIKDTSNHIVESYIWDKLQYAIKEQDCEKPLYTIWALEQYIQQLSNIIRNNIDNITDLSKEEIINLASDNKKIKYDNTY